MNETSWLADRVRVIREHGTVPGLLFQVTAERMRRHCRDRSEYHERRAAEKEAEIPAMEGAVGSMRESIDKIKGFTKEGVVPQVSNKMSSGYGFQGDSQVSDLEQQIDRLRGDIKDHRNKAASFLFLADSVFDQVYALEWADLARLELVK